MTGDLESLSALPPILRLLLVTDGTVTRCLQAYFDEPVNVECLAQAQDELDQDVPSLQLASGNGALTRSVRLVGANTRRRYVYAQSMLNPGALNSEITGALLAGRMGIGELLQDRQFETRREI